MHLSLRVVVALPFSGYWATPLHYVLPFIGRYDRPMACGLLAEVLTSFRSHGINEWVGPFWPSATGARPNPRTLPLAPRSVRRALFSPQVNDRQSHASDATLSLR